MNKLPKVNGNELIITAIGATPEEREQFRRTGKVILKHKKVCALNIGQNVIVGFDNRDTGVLKMISYSSSGSTQDIDVERDDFKAVKGFDPVDTVPRSRRLLATPEEMEAFQRTGSLILEGKRLTRAPDQDEKYFIGFGNELCIVRRVSTSSAGTYEIAVEVFKE